MTTHVDTETQQHIAAARTRWAAMLDRRNAEAAAAEQRAAAVAAHLHQELLARMAVHLPGWMLDYVQPSPTLDYETATEFVVVRLPGCAPLIAIHDTSNNTIRGYEVRQPLRLECDDDWWVHTISGRVDDLDQAIDLAASYGDSYGEMSAEAARRNAAGQAESEPEPEPVDQAADILARFAAGDHLGPRYVDRDDTIMLGSQLNTIAYQLRRIADAFEGSK